jgi:hypothetical protein
MKRGIVIELLPRRESFDFSKIAADIANGKLVDLSECDVQQHVSIVDSFRSEFVEYITEHGLSSLIGREQLVEALVTPGTSPAAVQLLLQVFLGALSVTTDLVIIDPYFFAASDTNYPLLVEQVLQPVLPTLRNLTVITFPNKVDAVTVTNVTKLLTTNAPQLTLVPKTSNAFHDRFWIDPISGKGILTGSSLSGLGKRYALVDHLQSSDAADVLAALRNEHLL